LNRQVRQGAKEYRAVFSGSVSEVISSSYLGALAVQFFSQFKIANESMPNEISNSKERDLTTKSRRHEDSSLILARHPRNCN
jgi:hypothetical protein